MSEKRSSIAEAPTVADVAAAPQRVGKVDFSSTLLTQPGEAPGRAQEGKDDTVVPLTSLVRPPRPATDESDESDEDRPRMPFILPPAKVDAAMAAEAERVRLEIAAARGELEDEPDTDEHDTDEPDTDELDTDETPEEVASEATATSEARTAEPVGTEAEPEPETVVEGAARADEVVAPSPARSGIEGLAIQSVADLDEIAAQQEAEREALAAAEAAAATTAAAAVAAAEAEAAAVPADEPTTQVAATAGIDIEEPADLDDYVANHHPDDRHDDDRSATAAPVEHADDTPDELVLPPVELVLPPVELAEPSHPTASDEPLGVHHDAVAEPDDALVREVSDVAADVVASMRRINELHERHVEALELETARRCELLTAQAELDAELIRLHARREAHAIISAARAHEPGRADAAPSDQLGEIGETFSRFAETIETTVAPTTLGSHDHLRKS